MPILPKKPPKAKLIAALMAVDEQLIKKVLSELEPTFGPVELSSSVFPFTYSDYYKREMGDALLKVFCSFGKLIEPDEVVNLKLSAIEIERKFLITASPKAIVEDTAGKPSSSAQRDDERISDTSRQAGEERVGRRVNIDPGYLDRMKLVLATTKDCSHRIYLGQGIYGDIELMYGSGSFACLEWTYPDYREPFAVEFFNRVRNKYLAELQDLSH